ncbi:tetratricopeptide repeat protein [Ottowia thiooxydans]|uniref:tetratricopeptide repeat protein n=1 Tax=Ottowia thiooxydans TaxID=219182 RepID=UPI000400EE75|nr:SEL1-like repeat protein [Ottowia thiooxydans]
MRLPLSTLAILLTGMTALAPPTNEAQAAARAIDETRTPIPLVPPSAIEVAPSFRQSITAPRVATPKIESRNDATPPIVGPPVATNTLAVRPLISPEVQRELQRLQRVAETTRGYGSSAASAQAAWLLGLIYLHGAGVRRDTVTAHTWFERAARLGREPWAYAGQAWCAIDGCQGPSDPVLARRAIVQLRSAHPARADFLEWVLLAREAPLQVSQPGLAQTEILQLPQPELLRKAASEGDIHALIELGLNAVTNNQLSEALEYFRRAEPGSQAAQANIRQIESRMDSRRLNQTAISGDASAAELLAAARKYHRGIGVPVNYVEAVRLYRQAEAKGSLEAKKMLGLIFSQPSPTGGISIGWMQQLAYADPTTTIPSVGIPGSIDLLYREPTPLFDLLPQFWRRQITQMAR